MKRFALLFSVSVTAILGAARAGAPTSAQEALHELHSSAALGAGWSGFGEGSYVRAKIHTVNSSGDHTEYRIEEFVLETEEHVKTAYYDGDHKEYITTLPHALDVPEFAEAKAVRLADDQVPVGGKLYPAQVFQFEKSFPVLREKRTIRWTFWLAPGVPRGELRRVTESESTDPTYGDREDTRLISVNVPFVVGKKKLSCYCRDSEDKYKDGRQEIFHICLNDSVPGGIVEKDARILENGKETTRQEYSLVDYHIEPVKP